ncbi:MAG: winged helix-turn-helix domain-containing protein, partial [Candidatus Levybacteria bacterium]|nr:winged helix-turn-helix domain-containing protein [Candidatus Levybacteria bacterium]
MLSDFHEFLAGHEVYLKLKDEVGLNFRISYLEKVSGKKIDEKLKEKVISLTGGHGKLTRLSLESLLAISDERLASSSELKNFLLEQKSIQGGLYEIWQFLTPSEKAIIRTYELGIKEDYLEKVGLLENGKIAIPLFEEFISTIQQSNNEIISYNPSTGEIKKGENIISDQLSASEFRLLRFLIENSGRIVEKEEIINAVWKDSKTQEGVTDQALDQIVYRLR